jgi:polyketide biosynthesis enoyl-CoA hydratase PksH
VELMRVPAALGPESVAALRAALAAGESTLEGEGGVFCRGLDLDWLAGAAEPEPLFREVAALLDEIARAPRPVAALVDGVASGGGVALAAAADLVVATPRATFALPEVFAGLVPAVALPWVARRTGWPRARLLALGGRTIDAAEALALGLVDEITGDAAAALAAHARRWAKADAAALAGVKRLTGDLDAALALQRELLASPATRRRLAPWEEGS